MDWTGLSTILPLGATGFALTLMWICIKIAFAQRRLADDTLTRYRAEVADHERTEQTLRAQVEAERERSDAERDRRRTAEEKIDELLRRVRSLEARIAELQGQMTELTAEVTGSTPHDDA